MNSPGKIKTARRSVETRAFNLPSQNLIPLFSEVPRPRVFWRSRRANHAMLGWGSALEISASGADRFQSIRRLASLVDIEHAAGFGNSVPRTRWVGGFSYHPETGDGWQEFGEARFRLPRFLLITDERSSWLLLNVLKSEDRQIWSARLETYRELFSRIHKEPEKPAGSTRVQLEDHVPSRTEWLDTSEDIIQGLKQEKLNKLVLARKSRLRLVDSDQLLGEYLIRRSPETSQWLMEYGDQARFFCHSPEYLVSLKGTDLRSECLAGTAPRSRTTGRDQEFRAILRDSRKDRLEHQLVVNYVRDRLSPRVAQLTFGERHTRPLSDLHHLCTPVRGRVRSSTHVLSLVRSLHPTPAVGGEPGEEALKLQQQIEPFARGWYSSPIGWFNDRGDGVFSVGIRGGKQVGDKLALYAGAGLVKGSEASLEWEEIELKFHSLVSTFGLRLI